MEDRRSDTEETFGDQPLPESVSNQNTEEAEGGPAAGQAQDGSGSQKPTDDPGSAKEGGQSTGHPENAG